MHTCPSDTASYVCGDLGYPCDGSTSLTAIPLAKIQVPLLVESTFTDIFGRTPTDAESAYWKKRFRAEKDSVYKVRRTMMWHKNNNSLGPKVTVQAEAAKVPIQQVNALFRSVYDGRNPTVSENQYWVLRLKDKPTAVALTGAMAWHKAQNIQH
ncbi:MAG: hypothetical protein WD972_00150 [Candidatus Andersenbacteria bacterium]